MLKEPLTGLCTVGERDRDIDKVVGLIRNNQDQTSPPRTNKIPLRRKKTNSTECN